MLLFGLRPSIRLFNAAARNRAANVSSSIRSTAQKAEKSLQESTIYEYKADPFTMKVTKAFSFSIALYATSLLFAFVSVLNPKLRPKDPTEEELKEFDENLKQIEHEFNTHQSNFITYSIKKIKYKNPQVYDQIKNDLFYTSLAALGYATAYFVHKSTKRIVTKITQKGPYLTVHFNQTNKTRLLEDGCYNIKYNAKKGLKQQGTSLLRIYDNKFQRANAEKKIFNLTGMNILELERATYPQGWMRFRNCFYGK
ncbi:hypothetical protein ACO0SA_000589 [Hanseniaspora valbyensis]